MNWFKKKKVVNIETQDDDMVLIFPKDLSRIPREVSIVLNSPDFRMSYGCYRVGDLVAVHQWGNHITNAGKHGIFLYNLRDKTQKKTKFQHLSDLVSSLYFMVD